MFRLLSDSGFDSILDPDFRFSSNVYSVILYSSTRFGWISELWADDSSESCRIILRLSMAMAFSKGHPGNQLKLMTELEVLVESAIRVLVSSIGLSMGVRRCCVLLGSYCQRAEACASRYILLLLCRTMKYRSLSFPIVTHTSQNVILSTLDTPSSLHAFVPIHLQ